MFFVIETVEEVAVADAGDLCPDVEAEALSVSDDAVDPNPNSTDEEKLLKHSATSILHDQPEISLRDRSVMFNLISSTD